MRQPILHSAMLEVRLFYQKGWSRDRIARFTFRLQRRRLRAVRASQARREALGPIIPGLMASFRIESDGDPAPAPIEAEDGGGARRPSGARRVAMSGPAPTPRRVG